LIGRRKLALALAVGLTVAGVIPVVAAAATSSPKADVSAPAPKHAVVKKAPRRYVALGDSVPYGFGLANPGTAKHSGLAPNQPPSRLAYPSLLAKSLGMSINFRKTGCTLTGDQLAVSGAPTVVGNINGPDVECHSSKPHKTVDPSELSHLGTAPAALVTLQVGADDVDFGGCLMHEIKIYVPYSIYGQNSRKCTSGTGLTGGENNRINDMRVALGVILTTIRRQQPDAVVVVLNYYQPIPAPSAFVDIDHSEVCKNLAVPGRLQTAYTHALIVQNALNRAIATEMEQHSHDHLVNLAGGSVFAGHEMCTRNPFLFTGGPTVGLWRFGYPNQQGQAAIAKAIRAQLPGLH
jgi:GDSL-like Lipase/Acylhydrolase family